MTLDEFRLLIPQYLAAQLGPVERALFEEFAKSDSTARVEWAELQATWNELGILSDHHPGPALRARFYQRLYALERPKNHMRWLQIAAAVAVFILGMLAGRTRPYKEMADMRQQVESLHETVALSLLDRQSATSRLEGISWSNRVAKPDTELRSALLRTLNSDPNVNVRLASLDALEKFSDDLEVRKELVNSIAAQDSPLVQIALIDAAVHMHDRDAASQLRKVSADTDLNSAVRQRAQWGLNNLGL